MTQHLTDCITSSLDMITLHIIPLEIICQRRRPERLNEDIEKIWNTDYDVNAPFSIEYVSGHSATQNIQRHCTGICSSTWTAHGHHIRVHSLNRALPIISGSNKQIRLRHPTQIISESEEARRCFRSLVHCWLRFGMKKRLRFYPESLL